MFSSFTRLCLEDTKVKHKLIFRADGTIDKTADPNTFVMLAPEEENKAAVTTLNSFGLDGSVCERKAPRLKENKSPLLLLVVVKDKTFLLMHIQQVDASY